MGPPDSCRIPRVPHYSGLHYTHTIIRVRGFHPLRRNFPEASALIVCTISCSYNPRHASTSRVWANPLSLAAPLLGESFLFSLPAATKMFQFAAFASAPRRMTCLRHAGFSHSDIRASQVICTYARLFAAYHVLRRLQEPRHPPYALFYFVRAAGHNPLTGT